MQLTAYVEQHNRCRTTGANAETLNVYSDARWISGGRALRSFNWHDRADLTVGEMRSDYGRGIIRQQVGNAYTSTYLQDQNLSMLQYAVWT